MKSAAEIIKTIKSEPEPTRCEAEVISDLIIEDSGIRLYELVIALPRNAIDKTSPDCELAITFYRVTDDIDRDEDEYCSSYAYGIHALGNRIIEKAIARVGELVEKEEGLPQTTRLTKSLTRAIKRSRAH